MERFTRPLMEQYGVRIIIGKGGLFAASQAAFKELGGVYLAIIGGAAALETTWIEQIEEVDLDDLNPESLWKFRVKGFGPLLVAMDSHGGNLYTQVNKAARGKRAAALASLGVKPINRQGAKTPRKTNANIAKLGRTDFQQNLAQCDAFALIVLLNFDFLASWRPWQLNS